MSGTWPFVGDADVKLWVNASLEERARRRFKELSDLGEAVTPEGVLAQLKERDLRDSTRKDAPMTPAKDALHIDTTVLSADEALARAIEIVDARPAKEKPAPKRPRAKAKPKA